jgi:hypothetical protein
LDEDLELQFEALQISHLRSPLFFHPDPRDRGGLLSQAHSEERVGELEEISGVVGKELSKHKGKSRLQRPESVDAKTPDPINIELQKRRSVLIGIFIGQIMQTLSSTKEKGMINSLPLALYSRNTAPTSSTTTPSATSSSKQNLKLCNSTTLAGSQAIESSPGSARYISPPHTVASIAGGAGGGEGRDTVSDG